MLTEKLNHFRRDPFGLLRGRIQDELERLNRRYREYPGLRYAWPIYDITRYFRNREAARLYTSDKTLGARNSIQQHVIDELGQYGICVIHIGDLFPTDTCQQLRESGERYVQLPSNQQVIESMLRGDRPNTAGTKEYVLSLLGEPAVIQRNDIFLQFSLDRTILAIGLRLSQYVYAACLRKLVA
jgi:hypothetical protein